MTGRIDPRTPTYAVIPGIHYTVLNTARRPVPAPPIRLMTRDETAVLMLALAEQPLRYKTAYVIMGERCLNILNSLKDQGAMHHAGYNDWRITEKGRIAAAIAMHKDRKGTAR